MSHLLTTRQRALLTSSVLLLVGAAVPLLGWKEALGGMLAALAGLAITVVVVEEAVFRLTEEAQQRKLAPLHGWVCDRLWIGVIHVARELRGVEESVLPDGLFAEVEELSDSYGQAWGLLDSGAEATDPAVVRAVGEGWTHRLSHVRAALDATGRAVRPAMAYIALDGDLRRAAELFLDCPVFGEEAKDLCNEALVVVNAASGLIAHLPRTGIAVPSGGTLPPEVVTVHDKIELVEIDVGEASAGMERAPSNATPEPRPLWPWPAVWSKPEQPGTP